MYEHVKYIISNRIIVTNNNKSYYFVVKVNNNDKQLLNDFNCVNTKCLCESIAMMNIPYKR